jgi:hypothetical protein
MELKRMSRIPEETEGCSKKGNTRTKYRNTESSECPLNVHILLRLKLKT